ncbi:BA14K family protein [Bradyrhizobium sp. BR 10289]|uniref:BA14K family protein n=1 Tax=Bradyrhizobium sp. BR 10289 TaxID=2749993 RepID=UPI001C64AA8F|nr:BA14K family protein [Bradyrhizobium sp. BR 10289]MBW7968662.1 BA14K family protein [Bradyrhizobium sp. BR 10289]
MRQFRTLLAGALAGATALATMQSASAAPLQADRALGMTGGANVETIQYRHGWRHGHYGYHHGYGHRGYGTGAAVIGGLAAGAIIGGAIANSQARQDAVSYCAQRYKSYDPASGTYLAYDGQRYACP